MAKSASPTRSSSLDELRERLEGRERSIHRHLEGLKQEVTTIADVNVGGRPVLDYVREQPLLAAGVAVGVGLVAGLVTGLMGRETPEEPSDYDLLMSAYLNDVVDDAGSRVLDGDDSDAALRRALRRRAPVIVVEAEDPVKQKASSMFGVLLNTALGFGVKFALDRMAHELTGEDEIVDALDSVNEPSVARPTVVRYD